DRPGRGNGPRSSPSLTFCEFRNHEDDFILNEAIRLRRWQDRRRRMLRLFIVELALGLLAVGSVRAGGVASAPGPVGVTSPDGRSRIEFDLQATEKAASVPKLRVTFGGRPVLLPSPLQVNLADGTRLGADSAIESSETGAIHAEYRQHPGKRSRMV